MPTCPNTRQSHENVFYAPRIDIKYALPVTKCQVKVFRVTEGAHGKKKILRIMTQSRTLCTLRMFQKDVCNVWEYFR